MAITKKERALIDTAMKRLDTAVKADSHNRTAAIEDLKFANGEQWDAKELKRRSDKGRPALKKNLLPKFIDQVVGDMLHNSPSVKILAGNAQADPNIAKIRQGLISNIEYSSNAKGIYSYGSRQMVTCGYGGWRVLSRYTEENPFLQEVYLEGIRNPFLIYMDPSAKDQNYADAAWGFLLEKMPIKDFQDKYPDANPLSDSIKYGEGLSDEHWFDSENITVAEYFQRTTEKQLMYQLEDGRVVTEKELEVVKKDYEVKKQSLLDQFLAAQQQLPIAGAPPPSAVPPQQGAPAPLGDLPPNAQPPNGPQQAMPPMGMPPQPQDGVQQGGELPQLAPQAPPSLPLEMEKLLGEEPKVSKKRETDKIIIRHWILTADEILEGGVDGSVVPGKYIPLVLLKGKELNVEGKNHVYGLIRHAKDTQKLINYWECLDLNTPLPTPTGWTTMGDVQKGDLLLDDKGLPCEVLGTSPINVDRDCFKITFGDGSEIVTDSNHLWQVDTRYKDWPSKWSTEIVRTKDLVPKRHFVYATKPIQLSQADLSINPYVLGVWLGDGDSRGGRITSGVSDVDELREVLLAEGVELSDIHKIYKDRTARNFSITDLTTSLTKYGLINNKHIPSDYLRGSFNQRLALLQGLMDTDGSIDAKFQCSYTTISSQLADGFKELLRTMGIKAICLYRDRNHNNGKPVYQFSFTPPMEFNIFKLPRKVTVQNNKPTHHEKRTKRHKIVSVIPIESVPTKCVMVSSPSNLFLAGLAMIPTHNTAAAEIIALAPKSQWLMTPKQVEGHEKAYASANVDNDPIVMFNVDPDNPGPPTRVSPSPPPVGIFEQIRRGEESLKSVIGMFNADLGAPGSEQTGAAITARQRPGDIGTFEFSENLARAVLYTGRVINEMIPDVYDTERDVRIRNIDDSDSFVPINTTVGSALNAVQKNPEAYHGLDVERLRSLMSKDGKDTKFNDVTVGKYDVIVSTGPSYATQRQESSQMMMQMAQAMPQQMAGALDLIVGNMDFKDAEELSERLRKPLVASGMVNPRPGESAPPPPPVPAEVQLMQIKMQGEQAKAQNKIAVEQGKLQLQQLKLDQEKMKIDQERMKVEYEKVKAELELTKMQAEIEKSKTYGVNNDLMQQERLKLERERFEYQTKKDRAELAHKMTEDEKKHQREETKVRGNIATSFMKNVNSKPKTEESDDEIEEPEDDEMGSQIQEEGNY